MIDADVHLAIRSEFKRVRSAIENTLEQMFSIFM